LTFTAQRQPSDLLAIDEKPLASASGFFVYNKKMQSKYFLLALLMGFSVSACGYQGNYRYSCQDPMNWEKKECNPPLCEIENVCWKDLVGVGEDQ
jgi:hypothetical protein